MVQDSHIDPGRLEETKTPHWFGFRFHIRMSESLFLSHLYSL